MENNWQEFNSNDLNRVSEYNPENLKFIVAGAKVWLNSGSPPLRVYSVSNGIAIVAWLCNGQIDCMQIDARCLTPEPTPIKK